MSYGGWDSVDLLTRFNQLAGRPSADAILDATKYQYLSDGQQYTITRIAGISGKTLFGEPTALSSYDGGYTWQFGDDGNGYPLFPMGRAGVYPSLSSIPQCPLTPGVDYLDEGVQIRSTNNRPLTGPLYWYGITPTQNMSATVQPVLFPPAARILAVVKAVQDFAESANVRNATLADRMLVRYEREFGQQMTMIRKHFKNGGALGRLLWPLGAAGSPSAWWM